MRLLIYRVYDLLRICGRKIIFSTYKSMIPYRVTFKLEEKKNKKKTAGVGQDYRFRFLRAIRCLNLKITDLT